MRPAGEVRAAIRLAVHELADAAEELGGLTYVDLAERAKVGYDVAHQVVKNMAREGELVPKATRQVGWSKRPLRTYMPAVSRGGQSANDSAGVLASAVRTWAAAAA